jgi:hypothetical protein
MYGVGREQPFPRFVHSLTAVLQPEYISIEPPPWAAVQQDGSPFISVVLRLKASVPDHSGAPRRPSNAEAGQ